MSQCPHVPQQHPRPSGLLLVVFSLFLLLPYPAIAAELDWNQLSERERTTLKPFKSQWKKYSQRTKKTMRAWARLSPVERAKIRKRHAEWQVLGKSSQAKITYMLKRYKSMSRAQRMKLKAWRNWVKKLPKVEQKKLHHRLPGMSMKQRKEYIRQLEKKYGKRK